MRNDFIPPAAYIKRTLIATLLLALSYFVWAWFDNQLYFGLGVLMGAAWGCLNLYLVRFLVENLLTSKKNVRNICFLLGVKFPLLYSTGYAMLSLDFIPPYSLVCGFTLFLSVVLGMGARVLSRNNAKQASEH